MTKIVFLKIFLLLFLSIFIITEPCFSQDRTYREDTIRRREDTIKRREDTIIYRDDTIIYREALIKYFEDSAYYRFGETINGIYVIRLQNQEYINAHIIIDNSPELNISRILGNAAIGGIVIITSIFLPMLAPSLPPLVAVIVTSVNAAQVVQASLTGAAIGAGISGITAYIESGRDPNETFNRALEGASDGFKWGAVLSYGTQVSSVAFRLGNATVITNNFHLAGKTHPKSGVPFVERIIEYNGKFFRGAFPEFSSKFNATLPNNFFMASDPQQFLKCMEQLREAVRTNNQLARSFTREQLQQIMDPSILVPDGFTWHHNEIAGRMQLVDFAAHQQTGHTGGRFIWGGGGGLR